MIAWMAQLARRSAVGVVRPDSVALMSGNRAAEGVSEEGLHGSMSRVECSGSVRPVMALRS